MKSFKKKLSNEVTTRYNLLQKCINIKGFKHFCYKLWTYTTHTLKNYISFLFLLVIKTKRKLQLCQINMCKKEMY